MIRLSIITINYNNLNGLIKTVESVLSQTSNDFEYIIIDGGSNDGSKEYLESIDGNLKISYWVSEKDTGIYHAMNKGIVRSQGEYLQFLNSGDWLIDNTAISRILSYQFDESFVYGNKIKVFSDGRELLNKKNNTESLLTFFKGSLNHATTLIKKSLFDKYGLYDESLRIVSDWKFFLLTIGLNSESVRYIDENIVYFDMNGISSTNKDVDTIERRKVLEELLPDSVLKDYDNYAEDIFRIRRMRKYGCIYKLVCFIERVLFKYERTFKKNKIEK